MNIKRGDRVKVTRNGRTLTTGAVQSISGPYSRAAGDLTDGYALCIDNGYIHVGRYRDQVTTVERMADQSGTVRLAFLATLLLAVVPVSLVVLFLASLAGGIAGVVA